VYQARRDLPWNSHGRRRIIRCRVSPLTGIDDPELPLSIPRELPMLVLAQSGAGLGHGRLAVACPRRPDGASASSRSVSELTSRMFPAQGQVARRDTEVI
jgi:hypothetical protein